MYPFHPRSTARLKAGQYWIIPLKSGCFDCGVVIARLQKEEKISQRLFLAGLLDWTSDRLPASDDLSRKRIKAKGYAHIKAITETGGEICGEIVPSWETPETVSNSDSISTWGFNVIRVLAEKYYGKQSG
jgi:hypothetical protein